MSEAPPDGAMPASATRDHGDRMPQTPPSSRSVLEAPLQRLRHTRGGDNQSPRGPSSRSRLRPASSSPCVERSSLHVPLAGCSFASEPAPFRRRRPSLRLELDPSTRGNVTGEGRAVAGDDAEAPSRVFTKAGISPDADLMDEHLVRCELLGRGSSGAVYLGVDVLTGVLVAVKTVSLLNDGHRAMLRQEIKALQTQRTQLMATSDAQPGDSQPSQHIVEYYGMYFSPTEPMACIVVEYMANGDLQKWIDGGNPVSEDWIAVIAYEVLSALIHLEHHQRIHRDIKPGNILVSKTGQVKLSDFGITRALVKNSCSSFVGTINYMSPERLTGEEYSLNSDVWSLGMCLATCALGRCPFPPGLTFWQLLQKLDLPHRLLSKDTSPELYDLITQCLTKDPRQRPQAKDLISHAFLKKRFNWDRARWLEASQKRQHALFLKNTNRDYLVSVVRKVLTRRRELQDSSTASGVFRPLSEDYTVMSTLAQQLGVPVRLVVDAVEMAEASEHEPGRRLRHTTRSLSPMAFSSAADFESLCRALGSGSGGQPAQLPNGRRLRRPSRDTRSEGPWLPQLHHDDGLAPHCMSLRWDAQPQPHHHPSHDAGPEPVRSAPFRAPHRLPVHAADHEVLLSELDGAARQPTSPGNQTLAAVAPEPAGKAPSPGSLHQPMDFPVVSNKSTPTSSKRALPRPNCSSLPNDAVADGLMDASGDAGQDGWGLISVWSSSICDSVQDAISGCKPEEKPVDARNGDGGGRGGGGEAAVDAAPGRVSTAQDPAKGKSRGPNPIQTTGQEACDRSEPDQHSRRRVCFRGQTGRHLSPELGSDAAVVVDTERQSDRAHTDPTPTTDYVDGLPAPTSANLLRRIRRSGRFTEVPLLSTTPS